MTNRDSSAIYVHTVKVSLGLFLPRQYHTGKRFIDLNQVDLGKKAAFITGASSPLVAFQTISIQIGSSEVPSFRHHFSADALIEMRIVVALHHCWTKWLSWSRLHGRTHGDARHALNSAGDGD